jgi:POT family proton-dependent oligopeptide transporter
MWERYGFYVIQTLLAIYLAFHFQWPDSKVYSLVGSFTALTYLSPFVGGWIADRFLGQKAAVLLGAIILLLSYVVLGFGKTQFTLMHALASIAIGTGLLKPNIASLLGAQYTDQCAHREHGFTIFYLGITTGIILGTTVPSVLKHYFGWQIAFISAAVGLLFSIITFVFGILRHHIDDYHPKKIQLMDMVFTTITLMLLWPICGHILLHPKFADIIFPLISLLAILYLFYCIYSEPKTQSIKTLLILLLCTVSTIFWAFYFQMFMSLTLFIIRAVQSELFQIQIAPPYYVALQSLGMIVLGLLLTRKNHQMLPIAKKAIDISKKFSWAMLYMLLAYGLIVGVCKISAPDYKISPLFIAGAYLFISVAELLLSPVGISAITVLSCRKKVSTMMGIFFVSLGVGGFLSGKLANLTAIEDTQAPLSVIKLLYTNGFINLSIILSLGLLFTLMIHLFIKKYISKQLHLTDI